MSLGLYIGLSIFFVCAMYAAFIVMIPTVITLFDKMKTIENLNEFETKIIEDNVFITCLIILASAAILKFITSIVYGKHGNKNPITFSIVMKFVSMPLEIVLLVIALLFFVSGVLLMLPTLGYLFAALIFIVAIFIVILIAMSSLVFFLMSDVNLFIAAFSLYSDPLCVFTYIIHQRKMQNRKFQSKKTVMWLIFLWLPILNVFSLFELNKTLKNGTLFSERLIIDIPEDSNN